MTSCLPAPLFKNTAKGGSKIESIIRTNLFMFYYPIRNKESSEITLPVNTSNVNKMLKLKIL